MKDLEGRVAVVAGATRGAGRSTTNFFSGNGISVAAMCAESYQRIRSAFWVDIHCASLKSATKSATPMRNDRDSRISNRALFFFS